MYLPDFTGRERTQKRALERARTPGSTPSQEVSLVVSHHGLRLRYERSPWKVKLSQCMMNLDHSSLGRIEIHPVYKTAKST